MARTYFPLDLVLAILLFSEGLGDIRPQLAWLLGWTVLVSYTAIRMTTAGVRPGRSRMALAVGVGIGVGALLISTQTPMAALAVAAWLIALRIGLDPDEPSRSEIEDHLSLAYGFSMFAILYHQDGFLRNRCDLISAGIGGGLADLLGGNWRPASTALPLQVIVAFLIAGVLAAARARRGSRLLAAASWLSVLMVSVLVYTAAATTIADIYTKTGHFAASANPADITHAGQHDPNPIRWVTPLALLYPISSQLVLVALLWFGVRFAVGRDSAIPAAAERAERRPNPSLYLVAGVILLMAIAAAMIWTPRQDYAALPGLRILIHKRHLDWSVPRFGSYGDRAGGMFGMLPDHLRARGCIVTAEPIVPATNLEDFDVVILINLQERIEPLVKDRLREYVDRGGGLLLAGDHTGLNGLREPINDLVGDLGIEINFDSAKPFARGWTNGMEFMSHPVTRGLPRWINEASIWVGASLDVRPPAYPVVIGRYAFSDPGDQTNERARLGDMRYSAGERLGDIPLVAARELGAGRILVWGDTSPLQNGAWLFSHRYMERTVGWLGRHDQGPVSRLRPGAGSILLVASLCAMTLPVAIGRRLATMSFMIFGISSLSAFSNSLVPTAGANSGARAYIDAAHLPGDNLDTWLRDGFGGCAQTLARTGLLPYIGWDAWDRSDWDDAALIVLLSPRKVPTSREMDRLIAFVENGGHVLLTMGWEEQGGFAPILRRLGLKIGNTPLGSIEAKSWEGKPVLLKNAWPVLIDSSVRDHADVIAVKDGVACAIRKRAGKGSFTLVGDSRFLRNENLESRSDAVPENIEFLRSFVVRCVTPPSRITSPRPTRNGS